MKFSLVICTYKRAQPLLQLLESVRTQVIYPFEILIIDGSPDDETKQLIEVSFFAALKYYKVSPEQRGLTRQRNFGIDKVNSESDVICFLDDDTVLERDYFEKLQEAFRVNDDAIGIGGISINENNWKKNTNGFSTTKRRYVLDGYYVNESSRNYLRNYLGLQSNKPSGIMPEFGHGKTFSYPLNNKSYPVDLLIGMSMSFKKNVFEKIKFSEYFNGYGLYEDADFSLRALQFGQNYIATSVRLSHFHNPSGRPNKYDYGKMVVRNGYYVWKVKYANPSMKARFKWHAITILLTFVRFTNVLDSSSIKRKEAFTEAIGRTIGWWSLFFNVPKNRN